MDRNGSALASSKESAVNVYCFEAEKESATPVKNNGHGLL